MSAPAEGQAADPKADQGQKPKPAHLWKPGQSGNPSGLPKTNKPIGLPSLAKSRAATGAFLFTLLASTDAQGQQSNAQRFLDKILSSEVLMAKMLDKMLPTMTPEQTNLLVGTLEQRILNLSGQAPAALPAPQEDAPPAEEIIEAEAEVQPGDEPAAGEAE